MEAAAARRRAGAPSGLEAVAPLTAISVGHALSLSGRHQIRSGALIEARGSPRPKSAGGDIAERPRPTPGVGVVMVSSIACATFATWKRAAGIREPSHHDRHAQMRSAPLLLRATSTHGASRPRPPPVGEREHAGSVLRLAVVFLGTYLIQH